MFLVINFPSHVSSRPGQIKLPGTYFSSAPIQAATHIAPLQPAKHDNNSKDGNDTAGTKRDTARTLPS
jgi:hypothetical protein